MNGVVKREGGPRLPGGKERGVTRPGPGLGELLERPEWLGLGGEKEGEKETSEGIWGGGGPFKRELVQ